eukprot:3383245-Amphidinium_carterae.1
MSYFHRSAPELWPSQPAANNKLPRWHFHPNFVSWLLGPHRQSPFHTTMILKKRCGPRAIFVLDSVSNDLLDASVNTSANLHDLVECTSGTIISSKVNAERTVSHRVGKNNYRQQNKKKTKSVLSRSAIVKSIQILELGL